MTIPRNLSFLAQGASSTGVLSVPYGGTGVTSMTVGYIPYGNGTSALSSSANLTFNGTQLGIGTTSPNQFLTVFDASNTTTYQMSIGASAGGSYNIGRNFVNGYLTFYGTQSGYDGYVFTGISGEKVRIFASGGVSIGNTTDPGATNLSVTGTTDSSSFIPKTAPSTAWGLDFAPSSSNGSYVSIANGATYDLASGSGVFYIYDDGGNGVGTFYAYYGSVNINFQSGTLYTAVSGTPTKVNIYYNAGTAKYRIQNNFGSTLNFYISTIRLRLSS